MIALTTWPAHWLQPGSRLTWEDAAEQGYALLSRGLVTKQ